MSQALHKSVWIGINYHSLYFILNRFIPSIPYNGGKRNSLTKNSDINILCGNYECTFFLQNQYRLFLLNKY